MNVPATDAPRSRRRQILALPILLSLAACSPAPSVPPTPGPSELSTVPDDQLEARLDGQIESLGLDRVDRAKLEEKLARLLDDPGFKQKREQLGVRGTGWFRMGEGGAVVKYANGSGELDLEGGPSDLAFGLRAFAVGGLIGGSASKGLVIVLGLEREATLPGEYRGEVTGATAVTEDTTSANVLRHARHGHTMYVLDVSKGMSANAGVTRVELSLR